MRSEVFRSTHVCYYIHNVPTRTSVIYYLLLLCICGGTAERDLCTEKSVKQ